MLESGILGERGKEELARHYETIDPVKLQQEPEYLKTLLLHEADHPADSGVISEIKRLRKNNGVRLQTTPGLICSKRYDKPPYYPKKHGAFDDFMKQVKGMIKADPEIGPGDIMKRLQKENPGVSATTSFAAAQEDQGDRSANEA